MRRLGLLVLTFVVGCSDDGGEAPAPSEPVRRVVGNFALQFDGTSDYATLATASYPFPSDPQTASFWVRASSGAAGEQTMLAVRKDFDSGYLIGLRDGILEVWAAYAGRSYALAPSAFPLNAWHHVTYVFENAEHRLYIDGTRVASGAYAPGKRTPTTAWLGTVDGRERFFTGELDEVRVWAAARTDAEILAEAQGSIAGDRSTLVGYYGFDEGEGARIYDDSGLENHGLLGDGVAERSPSRVASDIKRPP